MENNLTTPFTECSICLTPIHNSELKTLPCEHSFHTECIDEWMNTSKVEILQDEEIITEWACPLCRYVMSENVEMKEEMYAIFSFIAFKKKRSFIKLFTFLDGTTSALSFMLSGDLLYVIMASISIYGYNGAHNLNIHHLRLYAWFCTLPLIMKVMYFIILI